MAHILKINAVDRFPGQASSLSHIGKTNKVIKKKLTPTQLDMFKRTSIFGRLVDLDLVFNSPLVHHILLREVNEERPNVMSFEVNGTIITFSQEEFLLVTGLWPSPNGVVQKKLSHARLRAKYFNDRNDIYLKDFEEEYQKLEFENDEDAVKVSLVYFIELAMMGKEKSKTIVDKTLYGLVDDLDYFNSMDWGTIIWQRTLTGLQKALTDKVTVYKENAATKKGYIVKYNLSGFPHAFQVWAYETIHSLRGKVVDRLNEEAIPRMLRWSCSHSVTFRILERDIFENPETMVTSVLQMSDAEREYQQTPILQRRLYNLETPIPAEPLDRRMASPLAQWTQDSPTVHSKHDFQGSYMDVGAQQEVDNIKVQTKIQDVDVRFDNRTTFGAEPDVTMGPSNPVSTSRNSQRQEGLPDLNSRHTSYLELCSRVEMVEEGLHGVKEELHGVKSELKTLTSLITTLCKSKGIVDDGMGEPSIPAQMGTSTPVLPIVLPTPPSTEPSKCLVGIKTVSLPTAPITIASTLDPPTTPTSTSKCLVSMEPVLRAIETISLPTTHITSTSPPISSTSVLDPLTTSTETSRALVPFKPVLLATETVSLPTAPITSTSPPITSTSTLNPPSTSSETSTVLIPIKPIILPTTPVTTTSTSKPIEPSRRASRKQKEVVLFTPPTTRSKKSKVGNRLSFS